MDDILTLLRAAVGDEAVLTGEAVTARSNSFLDSAPMQARAIVRPQSTAEVATVLQICGRLGQPVVTQGGLTNLVASTLTTPADLVLSLERMNAIEELDTRGRTLTVQAGATLAQVQETASAAGLLFPLDLAARGSCTIGGNVATNAGGVRVLRYGMMRNLVLGLEAVLADGTVLSSLNRMLKDNAGYDLKQLFIGSEGTLGVITRVVLRLFPRPHSAVTLLLAAERFESVIRLLSLAESELGASLASFEVMWPEYYQLTTTPPALSSDPFSRSFGQYTLVETLGDDRAYDVARMERFLSLASEQELIADAVLAQTQSQREALWRIREDSEQIERQYRPTFGFDVSLPIGEMEQYVAGVRCALADTFGTVKCWVYGHVADGNLHLSVWSESIRAGDQARVEAIVYRPLARLRGSISAEHGVGLEKKPYLSVTRTASEIAVMRRLKAALDPSGILNPGKIFDAG